MDIRKTVEIAKELCYRIAPKDLPAGSLRIVARKTVPPILTAPVRVAGCTSSLELTCSQRVETWSGRQRPVIILGYLDLEGAIPPRFANRLVGAVIHGVAHYIEQPHSPRASKLPGEIRTDTNITSAIGASHGGLAPPWKSHSGQFLRIAFHLQQRARLLGYDISPREVLDTASHGLSSAQDYAVTIEAEARGNQGRSLDEIRHAPLPASFKRLFESDKRLWLSSESCTKGISNEFNIIT